MYALANIVETINTTSRALQGKQLLLGAQKQHLKKQQQELMQFVGVSTGGVVPPDVPGVFQLGCF